MPDAGAAPNPPRARRRFAVATAVAVAVAVLVGATGAEAASSGSSTGTILKAGVIVAGDVPSAWTSVPAQKNAELLRDAGIPSCAATRAALRVANRGASRAFSRQFVAPDRIGVAQDVVFAGRTVASARTFIGAYGGAQGQACVQAVVDQIAKRASGTATVTPLPDLAGSGEEALGYQFLLAAPNNGVTVTGVFDLVLVRLGRAVAGFQFQNAILPLPDRPGIVQAVVTRLRAVPTG